MIGRFGAPRIDALCDDVLITVAAIGPCNLEQTIESLLRLDNLPVEPSRTRVRSALRLLKGRGRVHAVPWGDETRFVVPMPWEREQ